MTPNTTATYLILPESKLIFKTKRLSSYDRTGGNNDRFENIKDGEVKELFNVKGAGMINHIWITIAPPPEQLNRNDIILRMYWDGNTLPSVESPIGPFFRQGWNESYSFVSLPLAVGPKEGRAIEQYHYVIKQLVFKWLNRRSQKTSFNWKGFEAYLEHYPLPEPRIVYHLYTLSFVS